MQRVFLVLLTAMAVVVLPQVLQAEPPRPESGHHGPGMLFQRLDQNKDGKITADEVPDKAPEFIKGLLVKADANKDKVVTAEELKALAAKHHKGHGDCDKGHRGHEGHGHHDKGRSGHHAGPPKPPGCQQGRPGPHAGPPRGPMPDPKAIFARLDHNKDGKLCVEEFAAGMKALHARHRGGPPPHGVHGPRPGGPPPHGMHGRGPGGPPPHGMHGRGPGGPPSRDPGQFIEMIKKHLKEADKNKDGKISKEEAPERMKAHFDKIDANKDGQVDQAEIKKMFEEIQKKIAEFRKSHAQRPGHGPPCPKAAAKTCPAARKPEVAKPAEK